MEQARHDFFEVNGSARSEPPLRFDAELAQFPATHVRSLALSLHDQCHDASDHDDEQDWPPYPSVSTHPAHAPPITIHHVSVLRHGNAGGEQRKGSNNASKQSLHDLSQ
jgi:hypothetical protein